MKVLVTGASGQLGPFVIRALRERHDLVLMSRQPPDAEFAMFSWIQGDLTVYDDCQQAVQGVDAIQHLAAQPWPVDHPALRERAAAQGFAFDATLQSNGRTAAGQLYPGVWHTYLRDPACRDLLARPAAAVGARCRAGHQLGSMAVGLGGQ